MDSFVTIYTKINGVLFEELPVASFKGLEKLRSCSVLEVPEPHFLASPVVTFKLNKLGSTFLARASLGEVYLHSNDRVGIEPT